MTEQPETLTFSENILYKGRIYREGKVLHLSRNLRTNRDQVAPKFLYAKRPSIGAIYRVTCPDETYGRFYSSGVNAPKYVGMHPNSKDIMVWRAGDEDAALLLERDKMQRKQQSEDFLDKLTIAELRVLAGNLSLRERRVIFLHIMQKLGL